MSAANRFNSVSQLLHIYFGLPLIILGVTGAIFNVIIFRTLKIFRETTCAFYLTVVSLVNIGQLLTALLVRVLSEGFQTDIRSVLWICKVQISLAAWFLLVSLTGICLATMDQVLALSKYHHLSNLRFARRCIFATSLPWSIYGILILVYQGTPSGVCTLANSQLALYVSYFHFPVFQGFLPVSIMVTFSLWAFYNVRTLTNRRVNIVRLSRDRQLTAMLLCHVVFVIITILPYTISYIYSHNQSTEDQKKIARNNFVVTVTVLINYSSFAGSFYIYCCASKRFRKQFVYVIKIFMNRCRLCLVRENHNQIGPQIERPVEEI